MIMEKNWVVKERGDSVVIKQLMKSLEVTEPLANLMAQRSIASFDEAKKYFRPGFDTLHDPFLMKDMNIAVDRISTAVKKNEKILVYGDYDVDGTTSVSLMSSYLKTIHPNIATYIPDRYAEGYGVSFKGIDFAEVTLHVGLGTFSPVEVEDLSKHKMDSEKAIITAETIKTVNKAIDNKKRVCAVGTTAMRALESAVSSNGRLNTFDGWTNKFIFPPHDFSIANCMITNFHTPKSTLMMMAGAFAGYDFLMEAYEEAVKEKYKFYSYGDAMLII